MLFQIILIYLAIINLGLLGYEYNNLITFTINSKQYNLTINPIFSVMIFLWLGMYYPFLGYTGITIRFYKIISKYIR
jgi:hypothetical protein